jgi:hypothetical protein
MLYMTQNRTNLYSVGMPHLYTPNLRLLSSQITPSFDADVVNYVNMTCTLFHPPKTNGIDYLLQPMPLRETALLWLMAGCGLRVSEVAALKVEYLDGARRIHAHC